MIVGQLLMLYNDFDCKRLSTYVHIHILHINYTSMLGSILSMIHFIFHSFNLFKE